MLDNVFFVLCTGYGDLGFNLTAYICGIGSNFTQALYLLLVQRHSEHHLSVTEILQLNSFNTLPLLLFVASVKGEVKAICSYPYWFDFSFIILFISAISVGMLLNYSLFLCTSLTSALTTSVVGGLKALAQTLLGLFTFGGVSHNISTYTGITLNLIGGIGYIWARYIENKSRPSALAGLKRIMSFSSFSSSTQGQKLNGFTHSDQNHELSKHHQSNVPENYKS